MNFSCLKVVLIISTREVVHLVLESYFTTRKVLLLKNTSSSKLILWWIQSMGFGNPFQDDCLELLVLNTRTCADTSVVETVRSVEALASGIYQ